MILSTHTLDSSNGTHAAGIDVQLVALLNNNELKEIWSKKTDQTGRLVVNFEIKPEYQNCELKLTYNIENYFKKIGKGVQTSSITLNIKLPDPKGNYHLPIIISPHGASLWWSN